MKIAEVKKNLKKDPPGSFIILIHRRIGLYMSWVLINIFPGIKANHVTVAMGIFAAISAGISTLGIIYKNIFILIAGYIIYFLSLSLDCADGNIARIKNESSIKGVVIDRVVHNSTHPLIFLCIGFAMLYSTGKVIYPIIFSVAGVLVEFPPIECAIKDVKNSFVNQIVYKKTRNFDLKKYVVGDNKGESSSQIEKGEKKGLVGICVDIVKAMFDIDFLFIYLIVDKLLFDNAYYISLAFTGIYILLKLIKDIFMHEDIDAFMVGLGSIVEKDNK